MFVLGSIRGRLFLGFLVMLILICSLGWLAHYYSSKNYHTMLNIVNNDFNTSLAITELSLEAHKIRRFEKEFFIYLADPEKRAKYQQDWNDSYQRLTTELNTLNDTFAKYFSPTERTEISRWQQALIEYGKGFNEIATQINAGILNSPISANQAIQPAKDKFRVLLDGTAKANAPRLMRAQQATAVVSENNRQFQQMLLIIMGLAIFLSVLLIFLLVRSISQPIAALSRAAEAIGKGDLNQSLPTITLQDFANLRETLERMRISLKIILKRSQ